MRKLCRVRAAAAVVAVLGAARGAAACGGPEGEGRPEFVTTDAAASEGGPTGDPQLAGDADIEPGFDLGRGDWKTLQVSKTPGTISHDGALGFLPDGALVAAWSEPLYDSTSYQNIWGATLAPGTTSWSVGKGITSDQTTQNAYPSIAATGDVLHLVWNGYPEGANDIYYARYEAAAWGPRSNLTSPYEAVDAGDGGSSRRSDYAPQMATAPAPDGGLVVAFLSAAASDEGASIGPAEVRLLRLDDAGAPTGPPTTVIPAPASGGQCYHATVAVGADGHVHVAADCGKLSDEDIYYATDASGSWVVKQIPGIGRDDDQPSLGIAPDGSTVYLVWVGYLPCASRKGTCGDIFYTKGAGGVLGPVASVTDTPDDYENTPRAVVDKYGRLIVGFKHFNAGKHADVYLTWSDDGQSFAAPRNLTPNTDQQDDNGPTAFALQPDTGVPHILYWSTLPGSDPLNSEIMHAYFVPSPPIH